MVILRKEKVALTIYWGTQEGVKSCNLSVCHNIVDWGTLRGDGIPCLTIYCGGISNGLFHEIGAPTGYGIPSV